MAPGTQSRRAIPKIRIRSDFTGQSKRMCRREAKQGGLRGWALEPAALVQMFPAAPASSGILNKFLCLCFFIRKMGG